MHVPCDIPKLIVFHKLRYALKSHKSNLISAMTSSYLIVTSQKNTKNISKTKTERTLKFKHLQRSISETRKGPAAQSPRPPGFNGVSFVCVRVLRKKSQVLRIPAKFGHFQVADRI